LPKRLLIVCEYPTLLGGERSMLSTLPSVADAGFEIAVAAPGDGPLAKALSVRRIPLIPWHTCDDDGMRLPLDELRTGLAAILQKANVDILHANSLSTARISGPVASETHIPSIGHLRDIIKLSSQAIADLNQHRRLVAVSRATKSFHVAQGLEPEKCDVINNGVDLSEFQPHAPTNYLHTELNLQRNARFIAVIGQLGLRKGTDVALAAALQIAQSEPNLHWLIVGERTSNKTESREFEDSLRSIAANPTLAGRIHFLGSRTDIPQMLNECTLLVHAARQEPLGRILLESAASGVAIVATDVGGTREIFPPESNTACLIAVDDKTQLVDAVRSLLHDEPRRAALASAARHRAETAFDIRTAANNLVELYDQLI
jgi:glycosyltransferase involved in cell wall biosynthesis